MARYSIFALFILSAVAGHSQGVIKGQTDLSAHSFPGDGTFILEGEWEFYWNKLLTPSDFSVDQHPEWHWPYSWNRQSNYPALGYATYRVRLKMPEQYKGLSLHFPIINAAATIWLNGEVVLESGKVGIDKDHYHSNLSSSVVSLPDNVRDIELVIQVANWSYFSGGLAGAPRLDITDEIFANMNRRNGVENFFAGSLIAMFVYQLILYFLYNREKAHLWLSLICLGVAVRALIVHGGSFLLPNLFPAVPWEIWKKLEFGSVYAIVAFFPLYVYYLFQEHAPRKPIIFFVALATVLSGIVLATPQYFYGKLLDVAHIGLLLAFIYAVYAIGKAWRLGNSDARIILFGVLASFPFILAEILKNSILSPVNIGFMYLVEMGVLVFLLFQVYLLANHYAKAYRNLEAMNQSLEKMVQERTEELVGANTVKDRLLSVMSHDIRSPLNSLRGVLNIYNKGAITRDEFSQLTLQIENDLGKTSMLLENILSWTASQIKGVQLKKEKFNLFNLVEGTLQLFDTPVIQKKISIHHNVLPKTEVVCDRNILTLVLRNLLSNAVKFSHEGGKITVDIHKKERMLEVCITDQGVGMDSATLESLLSPTLTVSTQGTRNEKGTGLGLALCREYVQKAGGSLTVESTLAKGSTFTVTLPLEV